MVRILPVLLVLAVGTSFAACGDDGSDAKSEKPTAAEADPEPSEPDADPKDVAWEACANATATSPTPRAAIDAAMDQWEEKYAEAPIGPRAGEAIHVACGQDAAWLIAALRDPDIRDRPVWTVLIRTADGEWQTEERRICPMSERTVVHFKLLRLQGMSQMTCPDWSLSSPPA